MTNIVQAKVDYLEAIENVKNCINENQNAMRNFRNNRTEENKNLYKIARENHKKSIVHIKVVRALYKKLSEKVEA